jgi:hypothetical protein
MMRWGISHDWGAIMKRSDVEILSTEELWVLHQKVTTTLKAKIIAEKKVLEDRLSQLNRRFRVEQTSETPQNSEIRNNLGNLEGPREKATPANRTA